MELVRHHEARRYSHAEVITESRNQYCKRFSSQDGDIMYSKDDLHVIIIISVYLNRFV